MPTHAEQRHLLYTPKQLFDLVADVDSYSEFLPWCIASRVTQKKGNMINGDLVIGFKMYKETFSSEVTLNEPDRIDVKYIRGPFRYLRNQWNFVSEAEGTETIIEFFIDFEFKSRILEKLLGAVFNDAVRRMINAFEVRAEQVYGRARGVEDLRD